MSPAAVQRTLPSDEIQQGGQGEEGRHSDVDDGLDEEVDVVLVRAVDDPGDEIGEDIGEPDHNGEDDRDATDSDQGIAGGRRDGW